MIVEKSERLGCWNVIDRGRQFTIMHTVANEAYQSHLAFLVGRYRSQAYIANVDVPAAMVPRLPSLREFLELFAEREWDRKGMKPVLWEADP